MSTVREAINLLKGIKNQHVAITIWCEDDVLEYAQENEIKLTRKQARKIIDRIDSKQDSSIGIDWDTIDYYIDEVSREDKASKKG
ncbi:hypothetical protein ACFLWS_06165 [Chloroflexota bacterium]